MERLDIHIALEVCEIVIESATLVPTVFALSGLPIYVASSRLSSIDSFTPVHSALQLAHLCRSIPIGSIDSNAARVLAL